MPSSIYEMSEGLFGNSFHKITKHMLKWKCLLNITVTSPYVGLCLSFERVGDCIDGPFFMDTLKMAAN